MYKNLLIISLHDILKKETLRMDFIYRMKSANNSIYFFFKKRQALKILLVWLILFYQYFFHSLLQARHSLTWHSTYLKLH